MRRTKHFVLQELLPPKVFSARGEAGWELLDGWLLSTLDSLRNRYGPMTVNNYHIGGKRLWSGLRTPDSPFYSPYSQHTFGRAADVLFKNVEAEEVRRDILAKPGSLEFHLIGGLELGTSWLHIDVRNCDRIKTFKK